MDDTKNIELELLQLIEENSEPSGSIILITETIKNIKYVSLKDLKLSIDISNDVEVINQQFRQRRSIVFCMSRKWKTCKGFIHGIQTSQILASRLVFRKLQHKVVLQNATSI